MILVRLTGGLGNQMFQYAYAKNLAINKKVGLKIDTSLLGNAEVENMVVRYFDLDVFQIEKKESLATQKEVVRFNGETNPNLLDRIIFRLKGFFSKNYILVQKGHDISAEYLAPQADNICVVGRWQSERFFENQKEQIKKIFSFEQFTPNQYSINIANKIKECTAVSIQVRRGDYVTHPIYSKKIGALNLDYYIKAIALMKEKLNTDNLFFFIISDDIDWCKESFKSINENMVFVEQEKNKIGYLSDLWLLQLCKHAIISNSTFSWWGAWLGESEDSVIIAPQKWAKSDEFAPEDVIPHRWIKMENHLL